MRAGGNVHMDLVGNEALAKVLNEMKSGSRNRVMRAPIAAGMRVIRKEAKRRAPKLTGALGQALLVKVSGGASRLADTSTKGRGLIGMVGVGYNTEKKGKIPNYYAQRIHNGWKFRSEASVGRKSRQYRKWIRATRKRPHKMSTGRMANPFLAQASIAKRQEAFSVIRTKAAPRIRREANRLAAKHGSLNPKRRR